MTAPTQTAGRARAKPASSYVLEDQIGFVLRQVSQRHATIFANLMPDELTPMQFSALVKLYDEGPSSQNALGRLAAMDAATVKGVIDRLVARGLIDAHTDPEDGRLRLLSLTPGGRAVVEKALPVAAAITEETLAPLGRAERDVLIDCLKKLR